MARRSEGTTEQLGYRVQSEELQMVRDTAAHLGTSYNHALRWAIRFGWQHATSTTDHSTCTRDSPCAGATRGLAGRQHAPKNAPIEGQTTITHEAAVEKK